MNGDPFLIMFLALAAAASLVFTAFYMYIAYLMVNKGPIKSMFKYALAALLSLGLGWTFITALYWVEQPFDVKYVSLLNGATVLLLSGVLLLISWQHSKLKRLFK